MKYIYSILFLFSLSLQAQFQLNGIVKDAKNANVLPFASISTPLGQNTISDVDGKFTIVSIRPLSEFSISYIGYEKKRIVVDKEKSFYPIFLELNTNHLQEVLIPRENPAVAIIRKTIALKAQNNPEKRIPAFEFKCYNSLVITANPDSINGKIDTLITNKKSVKIDSSNYKFKKMIQKQHLFQTEKVSLYQYKNNHLKETILGSKMAGLKQPIYEILGFKLQSFSIYDSNYELFETKYNSPIANDALKEYKYQLLDSTEIDGRSVYMIHFKNKKKNRAQGLEGVLYIDQNTFAIAKAVMRIRGVLDISGTHDFRFLPHEKVWFPTSKSFKIVKGNNDDDLKLLGGTIQFEGDTEKDFKPRKKGASDFIYLFSKSANFEIQLNLPIELKKGAIALEISKEASDRKEEFWNTYRKDSLDIRSKRTYAVLDSIAKKNNLELKITVGRRLINGFIPAGPIDLDLRKFFSFNNYEGFRLGLGGTTNDRFSKAIRVEGYTAYGTKDGTFKYSIGIGTRLSEPTNSWIGIAYTDDVREIASTVYAIEKRGFKIYDPRPFNISTFYNYKNWRAYFESKFIPKTESIWEVATAKVEPKFGYSYHLNGKTYTNYNMTTAMVSLRWSPFSDYMQTPTGRVEVEKRFPNFTFQLTKSITNGSLNDFDFGKIDLKTEYEKKQLNGQKTSLLVQGGYTFGNLPLTHLYSISPNNITKETILQRVTIAGKNSFETMFYNEFFSSEYVYVQMKHGFQRITLFKKIKPSFVFVTRMAWGNLHHAERHVGLDFKTLNKGYFESGVELNQIYKGLGLVGFYRYGPNGLLKLEDNLAVKISYILDLGF
ncbi:MAG: hypothetical protein RLZZ44_1638 [Bacteroidota bacterium]